MIIKLPLNASAAAFAIAPCNNHDFYHKNPMDKIQMNVIYGTIRMNRAYTTKKVRIYEQEL